MYCKICIDLQPIMLLLLFDFKSLQKERKNTKNKWLNIYGRKKEGFLNKNKKVGKGEGFSL